MAVDGTKPPPTPAGVGRAPGALALVFLLGAVMFYFGFAATVAARLEPCFLGSPELPCKRQQPVLMFAGLVLLVGSVSGFVVLWYRRRRGAPA